MLAALEEAAPEFNARYDARSRAYEYVVYNAPLPSPFWRHYSHHVPYPLDVASMSAAVAGSGRRARLRLFRHADGAHARRRDRARRDGTHAAGRALLARRSHLYTSIWKPTPFCAIWCGRSSARCSRVGPGRLTPPDVVQILHMRRIAASGPAAPARGLYLVKVTY